MIAALICGLAFFALIYALCALQDSRFSKRGGRCQMCFDTGSQTGRDAFCSSCGKHRFSTSD